MNYAGQATLADGGGLSGKWLDEFRQSYTAQEVACLDKIVRMQSFANFFMSTIKHWRSGKNNDHAASCRLPAPPKTDEE